MKEKVLTDNSVGKLTVRWDGERFALIEREGSKSKVIILNPKEMLGLIQFAGSCGNEL